MHHVFQGRKCVSAQFSVNQHQFEWEKFNEPRLALSPCSAAKVLIKTKIYQKIKITKTFKSKRWTMTIVTAKQTINPQLPRWKLVTRLLRCRVIMAPTTRERNVYTKIQYLGMVFSVVNMLFNTWKNKLFHEVMWNHSRPC